MSSKRSATGEYETSKTSTTLAFSGHAIAQDLWLRIIGEGSLDMHVIRAGRVAVIGRGSKADIDLGDASVSRRHAIIYNNSAIPQIVDTRSANGTFLGDLRLEPERSFPIPQGTVIRVGNIKLLGMPAPSEDRQRTTAAQAEPDVIVASPRMQEIYELAGRVAQSEISVLILGETGSGKEVLAASIHRRSARAAKPFLCLNCGAFSEHLLESELFGHEKGAFTGAVQTKIGLLESADGGTVFLDEVGEMPPALQVKLLRVLEERKITRVGDLKPRPIDVRFLAATHRDLSEHVARGAFRQDLFFRINGISVTLPPLRERVVEIGPLARHFLASAAGRAGLRRSPKLSPEALTMLEAHDWPGNIRELRNVMERAVVLSAGEIITAPNLQLDSMMKRTMSLATIAPPPSFPPSSSLPVLPPPPSSPTLAGSEEDRRRILDALDRCAGNQTYAARMLGMSRSTLVARLELYDIPRPRRPREGPK